MKQQMLEQMSASAQTQVNAQMSEQQKAMQAQMLEQQKSAMQNMSLMEIIKQMPKTYNFKRT